MQKRSNPSLPPEWKKTDASIKWELGTDTLYRREFPAGVVTIPGHPGKEGNSYGFPHLTFVQPTGSVPAAGLRITNPTFDN